MTKYFCVIFQIILFVCLINASDCYKILLVFPTVGKSHGILGEGYVRNLLEAGHEVRINYKKSCFPRIVINIFATFAFSDFMDFERAFRLVAFCYAC